ncbi:MAG TPA: amidohydrolase family protein [Acidobacteriaceae bacterium]|nr:amidohydrolase family protein [Acidobacteriaceae bacterium]
MMRPVWVFLPAVLMAAGASAQQAGLPQTVRYAILMNGSKAGAEVDTFAKGGRVDSTFEYNDRGRGPKTEAHWILDASGMPSRVDVTGVDYLKAPVDEHFAIDHGQAEWKSSSEHDHAAAGRFYAGINTPAVEGALLVRLLARAGTAGVPLYPSGVAHLEKIRETTVHGSSGQAMHVTEYGLDGLSFEPVTIWMDDDLRMFAEPGPWFALLREGWESTNAELYGLQVKDEQERYLRLAQELTRHPAQAVAIEHVRLYDSVHATMLEDQTVVVNRERIAAAGPAANVPVPAGAERIDGRGKTLLPGLFDMHVHLQGDLDGILHVASGVTSVRDMGNSIEVLTRLDEQFRSGTAIGPRVAKAGLIDGPGPYQAPTGIFAATQQEANAAVNRYADLGYVQTKLYSSFDPSLVPEVIWLSHARGMRVSGHVPSGMTAAQFVEEGADEIQHINFILLNFLSDKVKDTRGTARFTGVGQYGAGIDLHSKEVSDFIALLQRHHTTVDVTLATFEDMFTARPGQLAPTWAPVLDRLPPQVQRSAFTGGLPVTSANDQTYRQSWAVMLQMTKRLYDAGVPILAGTDDTPGLMLHRELEEEVRAGIPPLRALQNATWLAATVLREESELGSIDVGKRADMVLVEGDPGKNISDIRRCRTVFKDGAVYDSGKLYEAVAIQPAP